MLVKWFIENLQNIPTGNPYYKKLIQALEEFESEKAAYGTLLLISEALSPKATDSYSGGFTVPPEEKAKDSWAVLTRLNKIAKKVDSIIAATKAKDNL